MSIEKYFWDVRHRVEGWLQDGATRDVVFDYLGDLCKRELGKDELTDQERIELFQYGINVYRKITGDTGDTDE